MTFVEQAMFKLLGRIFGQSASQVELHPSKTCPECGSQLARETEGAAPTDWHCPNPDCPPQVLQRVALWVSPEAMDIKECDAALVAQLVNKGLVRDAADFYRLKVAEIAALDGMNKETARKLFDAITASRKREAWRVLFGLNIPDVGTTEAQALCKHFPTLDALFAVGRERLAKLAGVAESTARSLTHWYGDPVNRKLVQRLERMGVNFKC